MLVMIIILAMFFIMTLNNSSNWKKKFLLLQQTWEEEDEQALTDYLKLQDQILASSSSSHTPSSSSSSRPLKKISKQQSRELPKIQAEDSLSELQSRWLQFYRQEVTDWQEEMLELYDQWEYYHSSEKRRFNPSSANSVGNNPPNAASVRRALRDLWSDFQQRYKNRWKKRILKYF